MPVNVAAVTGIAHLVLRCVWQFIFDNFVHDYYSVSLNLPSDRCVTGSSVVGTTSVQLRATGLILFFLSS